jgi:4-amino-4-deoxy-L-arabinose transferase-like glycosyltransferase
MMRTDKFSLRNNLFQRLLRSVWKDLLLQKMRINKLNIPSSVWIQLLFILTLLVYVVGIFVTLMEPDAVIYADIPMEMVKNDNFFEIHLKGKDWLDKPHFQFWMTAISYKFFGINNFGFKFPAILFSIIAIVYVYLFGKRFYSTKLGYIAALILMTAEHFIISNNDVRAEPYLAAMTIFAMYYFAIYMEKKNLIHLILGSAGLACLLMTKGLFTILPVASALGLSFIYEKKWKEILHWQWLAVIGFTLIFTTPTLISYYYQFDLHPEKELFGQTGVSGVRFFLWESQWGRFTNTGPIKGEGDLFFFLHSMLWAFAPWALIAYAGIYIRIKELITRKGKTENFTIFGFLFTFFIFSISSFQLPHYLNQLFPFLSIISAWVVLTMARNYRFLKIHYILMLVVMAIFIFLAILLHIFSFEDPLKLDVILVVVLGLIAALSIISKQKVYIKKILYAPAIVILIVNYYLMRQFYPSLLRYQSESEAAFYVKKQRLPVEDLVTFEKDQWSTDFYLQTVIPDIREKDLPGTNLTGRLVLTTPEGLKILERYGYSIEPVKSFKDFHVTTLNQEFLNKNTRKDVLKETHLVYIQ